MSPIQSRLRGGDDFPFLRRALTLCLLLGLWGCAGPRVGASPAHSAPIQPISQVSLERDCFGCARGTRLVLRADGTATRTHIGKARSGTQDVITTGTVRAEDFAALSRLVEAQKFFDMKDEYQDPDLQDGRWSVVAVLRGSSEKRVFQRDEAGPDALKLIEHRIDELAAKITFVAVHR
jgi:hypothetical protein